MIKPKEVASCLLLVGRFGLKAAPAYTPTAYIHRNFQSDNRKATRTSFENRLIAGGFCIVRVASHKVRLCRSSKLHFFLNYRTFYFFYVIP